MRELTQEEKAKMEAYREEWLAISTSTDEANWETTEKNISLIYEASNREAPSYVWSRSPVEASLYAHLFFFVWNNREGGLRLPSLEKLAKVCRDYHKSSDRVVGEWTDIPDGKQYNGYRSKYHMDMRDTLIDILADTCPGDRNEAKDKCSEWMLDGEALHKSSTTLMNNCFWGQHEWWIPYYKFPEDHLGVKYEKEDSRMLGVWAEVSKNGGWWGAFSHMVFLMDRPITQELNEDFQGHNENGPAVCYGDGFRFYLLDSMRVDEQLIMRPETQTVAQIDAEENQDIRSIRVERFGWPRYLKESGAIEIDSRMNRIENQLEALMKTTRGEMRMLVTCPTGRMFALGVPPQVKTCEEAQKWLAGAASGMNVIART